MLFYSIDRFEGEYAILEQNDAFFTVLKKELPENASEGDLLAWEDGWQIRKQETENRRYALAERRRRMLRRRS